MKPRCESCKEWIRLNCLNSKAHESGSSPTYTSYRLVRLAGLRFESFAEGMFTDEDRVSVRDPKSLSGDPNPLLLRRTSWNAGLPTGREPYGNGVPIVAKCLG
jgi:hypothetical protein